MPRPYLDAVAIGEGVTKLTMRIWQAARRGRGSSKMEERGRGG